MRCSDLKEGMLLQIKQDDLRGWFNTEAHQYSKERFEDIPVKFTIAPDVISFIARLRCETTVVSTGDPIMYLGKKLIVSRTGKRRNVRMVYVNGQSGYVEGRDFRHLTPFFMQSKKNY